MRSMFYAGAALMIGASIYGFIDFKKNSHKKEFSGMYKEEKTGVSKDPVKKEMNEQKSITANLGTIKESAVKTEEKVINEEKKVPSPKREIRKKRKFRFSEFSRGSLRDRNEEVVLDEQDTKKPDSTAGTGIKGK